MIQCENDQRNRNKRSCQPDDIGLFDLPHGSTNIRNACLPLFFVFLFKNFDWNFYVSVAEFDVTETQTLKLVNCRIFFHFSFRSNSVTSLLMRKLDWYILKKLFITFFFCMFLFTLIAVAVDSSEKTDDFVKSGLSTSQIITQYYFGFVPYIWGLLFPLFVFIAVIFFTSRMAARSEIV